MPPELARECLADAAVAAIGLLQLLAEVLESRQQAELLTHGFRDASTIVLIRETACHLNGALSDAGM